MYHTFNKENEAYMTFLEFLRASVPELERMQRRQFLIRIAAECGQPAGEYNFNKYYIGRAKIPLKHKISLCVKYQLPLTIVKNPDLS